MATLRGKTEKKTKIFPCGEGNSQIFFRGGEKNSTFSKNILPCDIHVEYSQKISGRSFVRWLRPFKDDKLTQKMAKVRKIYQKRARSGCHDPKMLNFPNI